MTHFTFITPTYNRPEQLIRCLQSVQAQTHQNWNIIVVNDGSNVSYSAIDPLLKDERIHYYPQTTNNGVNYTRNLALSKLQPHADHYICFLDDDEYLIENALETAQKLLVSQPIDWLVLQCFLNNNSTTYMAFEGNMDYVDDYLYGKNFKKDATHFIKQSLAKKASFSSFVRNGEEWTYFIGLAQYSKMTTQKIPVKYNLHQPNGLFLGNMHGKSLFKPYVMKLYRPFKALQLRPLNSRAWKAFVLQLIKLPLRLIQIPFSYIKNTLA